MKVIKLLITIPKYRNIKNQNLRFLFFAQITSVGDTENGVESAEYEKLSPEDLVNSSFPSRQQLWKSTEPCLGYIQRIRNCHCVGVTGFLR